MILYYLTGRQFSGTCETTFRPCIECGCQASCCCDRNAINMGTLWPVTGVKSVWWGGREIGPWEFHIDEWKYLVRNDGGNWPECNSLTAQSPSCTLCNAREPRCGEVDNCALPEPVLPTKVTIKKAVTGDPLAPQTRFHIQSSWGAPVAHLPAGGEISYSLMPGIYTITEADPGAAFTTSITAHTSVVTAGRSRTFQVVEGDADHVYTITNNYTAPPIVPPVGQQYCPCKPDLVYSTPHQVPEPFYPVTLPAPTEKYCPCRDEYTTSRPEQVMPPIPLEDICSSCHVFEVTVTHGIPIPSILKRAARELACHLIAVSCLGTECKLPDRVTSISRRGVSMEVGSPLEYLEGGKTGIYAVDLAIMTLNPSKLQSPSFVWRPGMSSDRLHRVYTS